MYNRFYDSRCIHSPTTDHGVTPLPMHAVQCNNAIIGFIQRHEVRRCSSAAASDETLRASRGRKCIL